MAPRSHVTLRRSCVVAVAVSLLAILSPAAAGATTDLVSIDVTLPLHGDQSHAPTTDILVDTAHGHILVSGSASKKVVELSQAGQVLHTAVLPDGAGQMARVGNTLYVGSCTGRTVTVFTASTFTKIATFKVASGKPCLLAAAGGKLWFATNSVNSTLASVTTGTKHTTVTYPSIPAGQFAVDAPETLYTLSNAPATLSKIDVSGTVPTVSAQSPTLGGSVDLVLSPDASKIVVTSGGGGTQVFDSGLNPIATLPGAYSAAFSRDGNWLGLEIGSVYEVFPVGSATPQLSVDEPQFNSEEQYIDAHHLAFSADSTQLYALSENGSVTWPSTGQLHIIDVPGSPSYATRLYDTASIPAAIVGGTTSIDSYMVTFPDGGQVNRTVHAVLTAPDGTEITLAPAVSAVSGFFSLTTPPLALTGVWRAAITVDPSGSYRGDARQYSFQVNGIAIGVGLTASSTNVVYGSTETLTAHASASTADATVLRIHRLIGTTDTVIASGAVDAQGNLAFRFKPARNASYYAEHPSDDTYNPAKSIKVIVRVTPYIKGAYASPHSSVGAYAVFAYKSSCALSGTGCPLFKEHLTPPTPGLTVLLAVQQHTASGWKTVVVWKHRLNSKSSWTFKIRYANNSVTQKSYRIIAASKATKSLTASAWGYWYFQIR